MQVNEKCIKKENACNSIAILTQIYQHHQSSKKLSVTTIYASFLYS